VGLFLKLAAAVFLLLSPVLLAIGATAGDVRSDVSVLERWLAQEPARPLAYTTGHGYLINAAASTPAELLIDKHTAAGVTCENCHGGGESAGDGAAELEGEHPPVALSPLDAMCVACHGTMLEAPEGQEMSLPNPHLSPHLAPGEVPACTECHSVHEPGEVTCNVCHRGFEFTID
jgi:Zn finger protein HypA/HybF involved in hydrogenase expression